tara:strand:- start:997 stop:1611 length:615 start_codon:yes stop_codon:yes gene_type:complete
MTFYLNKTEARIHGRNNLTIFDEVHDIMRKVIVASDAGSYDITISDTTMTLATPTSQVTGTVSNPTITGTPTLIIAGATITLGTTGTNLNSVIADINDAGVAGLVASKDASNNLVLSYTHSASNWSVAIGAGTANTDLGFAPTTVSPTNPVSVDYYNVWTGGLDNRKYDDEMTQVIKYFQNLGYNIVQQKNTLTNSTFKWKLFW